MRSVRHAAITIGLVLALLITNVLSGAGAPQAASAANSALEKIDPYIVSLINSGSRQKIPVIVSLNPDMERDRQKDKRQDKARQGDEGKRAADEAAAYIEREGGKRGKSLGLIKASGGTMNVHKIAELSRNPRVAYISYDIPMGGQSVFTGDMVDFSALVNAPAVWAMGYTGAGIGVAVIDSGVQANAASGLPPSRVVASINLSNSSSMPDPGGHNTHIAGIVGGQGADWSGIAPGANIIDVRVLSDTGSTNLSTVIAGIQWAVNNRRTYNIRVINLSLGGRPATTYVHDPLAAAVEMAWFSNIVVIAAAGNEGLAQSIHTPGHDPYVITVGALDPAGTLAAADDSVAFFSSQGPTLAGQTKPDLIAPGRKMVSLRDPGSYLDALMPDRVVADSYFRMSGTSQAAGVVSGIAALILQRNPGLKPNQVKAILKGSSTPLPGASANAQGSGSIDAYRAVATPRQSGSIQACAPPIASPPTASPALTSPFLSPSVTWRSTAALIPRTSPGTTSPGTTSPGTTSPGITSSGITSFGITWSGTTSPGTARLGTPPSGIPHTSINQASPQPSHAYLSNSIRNKTAYRGLQ